MIWDSVPRLEQRADRDSLPFSSPVANDPSSAEFFEEQTTGDVLLALDNTPQSQSSPRIGGGASS